MGSRKTMWVYLTYNSSNIAYVSASIDLDLGGFSVFMDILDGTTYTEQKSSMTTQYDAFITTVRSELVTDGYLTS